MRTYWTLLRLPGAAGFVTAGFLARLPIAMRSVGCILMISALTGSFALAGAVAASLTLSQAAVAPAIGRLVDRRGQANVIWFALMVNVVTWRVGPERRLLFATLGLALGTIPLVFADSVLVMAALTVVAGLAVPLWDSSRRWPVSSR